MIPYKALQIAATASLLSVAGCDQRDPYLRTDVWRPSGANMQNIAAMVADPRDMISGHGAVLRDSKEPVLAIDHIWLDQPKLLQQGGTSGSGASPSGGGGGGGGGGSGGSPGTPGG